MKNLLPHLLVSSVVCALSLSLVQAQVGIGTNTPSSKAVLELKSPGNNQGFLVPRLTSDDRSAISPLGALEKGLLVFDITVDRFYYWSGTSWIVIEDTSGTGTVTSITTGTGLTGGTITVTGTIGLANTGVAADVYGSTNQVPRITVDAQGRITGVTLVTISGILPGGAAAGDLTGNYPNPTVANNAITTAKISDGAVTTAKISASGATTGQVLKWNGTTWTPQADNAGTGTVTNVATGAGLSGGPITTSGTIILADNGVTTAKILDGTIVTADLADNSIASAKIIDGAVTDAKVASITASKISISGATTGQVLKWSGTQWTPQTDNAGTGTVTNIATGAGLSGGPITTSGTIILADNGVTTAKILDGTIVTADLADNSIASAKIIDGAVTDAKVTSITASKISISGATTGQVLKWSGTQWTPQADNAGTGTVTNIATGAGLSGGPITTSGTIILADNGVTTAKILDGSIVTADLADNSISSAKIIDGAVTDAKVTSITASKISVSGATTGQVLKWSGTQWTPQTDNAGTGTVTNIATGSGLTGGPITAAGTISLADGGVTTIKLADGNVTTAKILDGTILTGDLADGSVTDAKIATIAPAKIAQTGATTGQVLEWNGSAWAPATDNVGGITLPYAATQSDVGTLLNITNSGTGRAAEFNITNAASAGIALRVSTTGTGAAISALGTTFGIGATSSTQGGAAGFFSNTADRGYGALGVLATTGTSSYGVLGTTYINDGTPFGVGVLGIGDDYGVRATGGIYGGEFLRTGTSQRALLAGSGAAVYASNGENFENAITAFANGTNSYGVYASGVTAGVYGYSDNGNAIEGYSNSSTTGYAVYGRHAQTTGTNAAIYGETNSITGSSVAIRGVSTSTGAGGIGVYGSHAGSGYGVYASTGANGYGVVSSTSGTGYALWAINSSTGGYAGYFTGRVNVTGALSKGSGTFKIDHPLDPANKYLYHSFVESPDMKNIYDGVVTLDGNGQAEITLPDWFSALNKEFRYQLTCIGGFAPVYVSKEVTNNSFSVAGGTPGMKVSWQLTGIRKDAYAEKNRVKVEEDKTGNERGKYLYPEAFGLSPSMGINYAPQQQTQVEVSKPQEAAQPKVTSEQARQMNERVTKDPKPDNSKDKGFVKPLKINE